MDQTPDEATHLIERLRAGDRQALGELFDRYRDRLRRMVELRMDPQAAGPPRRLGRPPGGVPRRWPATSTPTCRPQAPALALAAAARRPAADHAAPPAPGHPDARRRAGDLALPRRAARGQLRGPGLDAPGAAHLADPGGPARRAAAPASRRPSIRSTRSTARSWPCGTSSSSAAPRRPQVLGISQEAGGQAVLPRPQAAQGRPGRDARRTGRGSEPCPRARAPPTTAGSIELAEEFAARFRRGERPSLQEYIDRCPELADEIRELFPALVEVEQVEEDQPARPGAAAAAGGPAAAAARSATTGSSARSAGAAWAWSTRPSRSRSAAAWP